MALKCPFCSAIAHCRASVYEAPSVKKTYYQCYQCQNLECSSTFTALESVHTIITRPRKEEKRRQCRNLQTKKGRGLIAMALHPGFPAASKSPSD